MLLPGSRTRDMRCCCERLLFRTGNRKVPGYLCAPGESVRVGRKNSRRGAAGQILGDSVKRRPEKHRSGPKPKETAESNVGKD